MTQIADLLPQMRQLLPGCILTEETRCIRTGAYWRHCALNATWRTMTTTAEVEEAYAERDAFLRMAALVEARV